jgi:hypothetical protein
MNYRMSMDRVDRSNAFTRGDRKVCKNHLLGIWGKDQFGNWYTQCGTGHRLNEKCEELIEKGDENHEQ